MPYSLFKTLNLGEPKPTKMSIQLADRSIRYPRGIIEDVLVKVDKLIFPVDFVIMEMEEDFKVPVILGRPFLATTKALIDVAEGRLILRIQDEEVVFDMSKAMKYPPSSDDSCFRIDVIKEAVSEVFQDSISNDPLGISATTDKEDNKDEKELEEQVNYLDNNRKRIT